MATRKETPTEFGYSEKISMFRRFTNAVAGTGAIFAFLHVFFGYMGFDKTPNATTGEVPSFLDEAEYRYYIVLCLLFALVPVVSGLLRRFPAAALVPSVATTTYLMLLFDADVLTAGPMTFLLFSLFVFAGHTYVSLLSGTRRARDLYRYLMSGMGLLLSLWALIVFFRAPSAPDKLLETLKPNEALDGLSAVWRYERLIALVETSEAGNGIYYLCTALAGLVLTALFVVFPKRKLIVSLGAVALAGYLVYLVGAGKLSYYPMLFVIPLLALVVACLAYAASDEVPEEAKADAPDALRKVESTGNEAPKVEGGAERPSEGEGA